MNPLLTPAATLAHFGLKDRHSLASLVRRGLIERVNIGGDSPQGRRWRYRLKPLEPVPVPPGPAEAHYQKLKRRHGW